MDIVLTDPRLAPRHARVAVLGGDLTVEALDAGADVRVNGAPVGGAAVLAPGDRIGIGATELTVHWTPGGSLPPPPPPPPAPPPPAPAPARPPPPPAPAPPPVRTGVLLPLACLALAAFSLVGVWMPAVGDARATDSIWSLDPSGLRVQAITAALLTGAAAGGWLAAATRGAPAAARAMLAGATALGGGLIAGLPLFLAAVDIRGLGVEAGLVLLALAGLAVAGCAVAGARGVAAEGGPRGTSPAGAALLAAGGGGGGALALVAAPLTWVSTPLADVGGFDEGFRAGGWLVPLALAIVAASALTIALARAGAPGPALVTAAGAAALAAAGLAFVNGAAIGLGEDAGPGLGLALAGTALAVTTVAIGAGAMAARLGDPAPATTSPHREPGGG